MKPVYIATPYTKYPAGREAAFTVACRVRGAFTRAGIPCYSPIAETHSVAKLHPEITHEQWLQGDFPILDLCGSVAVIMLDGWPGSVGVQREIERAKERGIPVHYLAPYQAVNYDCIRSLFPDTRPGAINRPLPGESVGECGMRVSAAKVRAFDTGATRSADTGKPDYEGLLSPLVLEAFGAYMNFHRHLPDGSLRPSDNWQKGIPLDAYMKSGWRHFVDWWREHRGHKSHEGLTFAILGLVFNAMGYLHEMLKEDPALLAVDLAHAEKRRREALQEAAD